MDQTTEGTYMETFTGNGNAMIAQYWVPPEPSPVMTLGYTSNILNFNYD